MNKKFIFEKNLLVSSKNTSFCEKHSIVCILLSSLQRKNRIKISLKVFFFQKSFNFTYFLWHIGKKFGELKLWSVCRNFRNVPSNSIKPWCHCPRDGGRAEIHKIFITPKLIKGRFNFGGGGVLLQNICLTL